jgi:hypothetical protein
MAPPPIGADIPSPSTRDERDDARPRRAVTDRARLRLARQVQRCAQLTPDGEPSMRAGRKIAAPISTLWDGKSSMPQLQTIARFTHLC